MPIRPFLLPNDLDTMNTLVLNGFQYPENPAWSVQADESEGMIDRVNGVKRMWPLMRFMQILSPSLRDVMQGYIFEEDGTPVGLINYMSPPGHTAEWMIANVTVLPTHRRHGIARKLVNATMLTLQQRKAKFILLEVIRENLPAVNLYKELGFTSYASETQFDAPGTEIAAPALPEGWSLTPLHDSDWRIRYELALRTTPDKVQQFEPISAAKFRTPFFIRSFGRLFDAMSGTRHARFALSSPDGIVAGSAFYSVRRRRGGVNFAGFVLDPAHGQIAAKFIQHVLSKVQQISPGRRIQISLDDWQLPLLQAAEEIMCIKRVSAYRMGIAFSEK